MPKGRRVVEYSKLVKPPGKGKGRGPRLWAYSYRDLAAFYGVPEWTVRQAVARGEFDPADLVDVMRYWGKRMVRERFGEGAV